MYRTEPDYIAPSVTPSVTVGANNRAETMWASLEEYLTL